MLAIFQESRKPSLKMSRIAHIEIDDSNLPAPTPEIEQERKVAVFDLLEDNSFVLPKRKDWDTPEGPYDLTLAIREKRLVFDIKTEAKEVAAEFHLSLGPFRQVVKDCCKGKLDCCTGFRRHGTNLSYKMSNL